jgi:hypothetical protein
MAGEPLRRVSIDENLERYEWVKLEVKGIASLIQDDEAYRRWMGNIPILWPGGNANVVAISRVRGWERVCMGPVANSRPFCYFYRCLFDELGFHLPLSYFEESLLSMLHIAPVQLHPNGWGFVPGYEILCRYFGIPATVGKFLHFFHSKSARSGMWVFINCKSNCGLMSFFKDSFRGFKNKFVRVSCLVAEGETILSQADESMHFPLY